jgi:hypothetical protein
MILGPGNDKPATMTPFKMIRSFCHSKSKRRQGLVVTLLPPLLKRPVNIEKIEAKFCLVLMHLSDLI